MKLQLVEERCSGCRVCEMVCALHNRGEQNPKKSAIRIRGEFPAPGRYHVLVCDQCGKCSEVCPTGAISLKDKAYVLNREECTGCGLCVEICDRKTMFTHTAEIAPIKCELCGECIRLCPRNAIIDADGEVVATK
ncbi:MAG: 4Fe-4S binding protein [Bacillota bacterium]